MKDWFQVQMLDDTTYVISEHKHYENTNCYLLLGKQRALLIDSGLGVADIRKITDRSGCCADCAVPMASAEEPSVSAITAVPDLIDESG